MLSVTNPVYELPLTPHQRSLAHHIDSCTTLTVALHLRLQFPSSIALTTHAADCTDHTLYINHGLPLPLCRVLFCIQHSPNVSYLPSLVVLCCVVLCCVVLCCVVLCCVVLCCVVLCCVVLCCVQSPVLFCVYHSLSVSCFTEPFLVSVSYFSLSLVFSCCLVFWFLIFCLVYWINALPCIRTLFAPAWTIACVPGLPLLSSPLYIVCRSKTTPVYLSTHLPYPQYTCWPFVRPCLCFWPCLWLKACTWICTPHVSFAP